MISQYPLSERLAALLPGDGCVNVVDAGARGGGELARWGSLGARLRLFNFEPDPEAKAVIKRMANGHAGDIRIYSAGLGRSTKNRPLYLSKVSKYNTSFLPINLERYTRKGWVYQGKKIRLSDIYEIVEERSIDCIDLDEFLAGEGIPDVDFIKVDIEGVELELLEASPVSLDKAVGVSVDVLFHEDWIGAPVFSDVDRFLRSKGFVLYDIRNIKHNEQFDAPFTLRAEWGEAHGQIACADAIYLRDFMETKSPPPPFEKLVKLAIAAEVNRHADYAFELVAYLRDRESDPAKKAQFNQIYSDAAHDYTVWMRQYSGSRKLSGLQVWSRKAMPGWMLDKLRPLAWGLRRLVTSFDRRK